MSSDSAIERLRALLNERGVKHVGNGGMTKWYNEHGCVCRAYTRPGHLTVDVAIMDASPEQAINATLGNDGAAKLQAENVKLRELVRGLDYCSDELNSAECERCPLYDPADPVLEPKCVRMMRELRIEVSE